MEELFYHGEVGGAAGVNVPDQGPRVRTLRTHKNLSTLTFRRINNNRAWKGVTVGPRARALSVFTILTSSHSVPHPPPHHRGSAPLGFRVFFLILDEFS